MCSCANDLCGAIVWSCLGCALRCLVGFGELRGGTVGGVSMDKIGLVAQLVEQFSLKEWVLGSSPSGTTLVCVLFFC